MMKTPKSGEKSNAISKSQWLILSALMLGVFLGALDISIVSPALPTIAKELNILGASISWIITLYTLVYVLAVPLMSSLSDRYGRKEILLVDIAFFAVGSLWAAFSPNLTHLLIARGIQALGAGGLFPIASTVVGEIFPKERHGMALGFIGMVWGVAAIIGPLVGGWITQWFGWTAIFYISFVLSLIVLVFVWKVLPKSKSVHHDPFDWLGMLLLSVGLLTLTYGLNSLDSANLLLSLFSAPIIYWLISSIAAFVLFFFVEKYPKAPVIPVNLFKKDQLNIGLVLSFARGMTEAGLAFLPFYAIVALDIGSGLAGTLIIATAVTLFLLTEPAGLLVDKIGAKKILIFGTIVTAIGAGLLVAANTMAEFIGYQVVLGIGLSTMSGAPIRYVVLHQTNDAERASAQSLVSLFSSFGIMIGSAFAGSFLALQTENGHPSLSGFHNIYWMVASTAIIAMFVAYGLKDENPSRPILP